MKTKTEMAPMYREVLARTKTGETATDVCKKMGLNKWNYYSWNSNRMRKKRKQAQVARSAKAQKAHKAQAPAVREVTKAAAQATRTARMPSSSHPNVVVTLTMTVEQWKHYERLRQAELEQFQ